MKKQNRISRESGYHRSSRNRTTRSSLCSCTEARVRQKQVSAREAAQPDPLPEFRIPEPLRVDQDELCGALERATLSGGETGNAARKLLKVLQPHLLKEEEDLLQTLGLLMPLSRGQITPAMRQIPSRTEHLKARMFEIVREHVVIIKAARELLRVARAERKLPLAAFTEHLMLRAWTDEVVFYPAAILIGEYLRLRLAEAPGRSRFDHVKTVSGSRRAGSYESL
ncbi:MAG TPA: hypothetical protein VJT54_01845 [Verrucomicrobiae bacterium]|nr:hypothetical protein [Verrucomicrobiae bacterium]